MALTKVNTRMIENIVFLTDFGAVGDAVTDDTTEIQAAFDSGSAVIDGQGKTYKVTSTLTLPSDFVLQNATLSFATLSDTCLEANGTQGSALTLTANANYPARTVSLSTSDAATLAEGDMVFITDTQDFATGVDRSEINFVSSVSGTTVTLASEIFTDYTTANTATISKITPKENLTFKNVRLIGADDATTPGAQNGLVFDKCRNVNLENCRIEKFDTRLCRLERCAHVHINGCFFSNSDRSGFGYGVAVSEGSHYVTVANSTFERMRHGVATGGSAGVIRFVNVLGCTFNGMKDAMLDAHPETDFVNYSNNISTHVEDNATDDGVLISGGHSVICNNIIDRPVRHGILIQGGVLNAAVDNDIKHVVSGNLIKDVGTASGIVVDTAVAGRRPFRGVSITGNSISGSSSNGINVQASGTNIKDVSITGNTVVLGSGNAAIQLLSQAEGGTDASIRTVSITGNTCSLSSDTPDACIELVSGSNGVSGVAITGNSLFNGTYGIDLGAADKVVVVGNMIDDPGTGDIDAASATNVTNANNG